MSPSAQSLVIDGFEYDITNFRHPGGNVIQYMVGQDASATFKEFHYRSSKAQKFLNSLPKKPVSKVTDQVLAEFNEWRADLERRGFFQPSYSHVAFRMIELVLLFGLGVYFIPTNIFLSLVFFVLFSGRCGWVQHEGGHNSLTGNMKVDKFLQNLTIGFGLLTDGNMWNSMHNKHHATPQKVGHDIDLDTTPLVAFFNTAIEKNRTKWFSRLWLRYQAWTFLPVTSGIFVMSFWLYFLHPRKIIRDKNIFQAFLLVFGHVFRTWLFHHFGDYTIFQSYLLLMVTMWGTGMYLFGQFSLSHTFTPVIEADQHVNWVEYSLEHSIDIDPQNPVINWVMGYLNCQVIHHLFPSMPQYKQPAVSKELVQLAKKWNMKYTIMGYWEAWYYMLKNLNDVGRDYAGGKVKAQ